MNLHGPVRAAEFEGTAHVVISLDGWPEGKVRPTTHEVTVLAPKKGSKAEPVTRRLVRTLPHPDRQANVGVVQFKGDGSRLLAVGYPSGVVQVWDAKAWKEVARLDTPTGRRSSWDYAHPTLDWESILVHVMTRKVLRQERGGKVTERLVIDGRIDHYDAATGKRKGSIPLDDRGPQQLFMVPGGKAVVVNTEGSFSVAIDRPQSTELIDLSTGKAKKLFDSFAQPAFAPDGKTAYFATTKYKQGGEFENALVKYDLAGGKVLKTKEKPDSATYYARPTLSPDGKRLFVVTGRMVKLKSEGVALAVLDADTFKELARIPGGAKAEQAGLFDEPQFSADGKTMITRCGGPLIVWDVATNRAARMVPVGDLQFGRSALSADGKTAVVVGMPKFDARGAGRVRDAQDLPQPRLVLIDLTDPKGEPEVLMLPSGMLGGVAFSPDAKTVAVGGAGGVHLIDVSARPKK